VTIRNLRLRDPLGEFPQLSPTSSGEAGPCAGHEHFEFGMITGRLSAHRGLETFDWMPVAFDAALFDAR